jgi:hypothetical protein
MTERICKIIAAELQCSVELRIAATLHRAGVTSDDWNNLGDNPKTCKAPWTLLPSPIRNEIMNHLVSLEKKISILPWHYGKAVNPDKIPSIPALADRLADWKADRLEVTG